MLDGEKKKAQKFFDKIQGKNFSSTRVKEIQLYSNLRLNNQTKAKELAESLSYKDLNQKDYNIRTFSSSPEILNPVLTQKDGLAEVFYNISSWYYQRDLYKFSIFFGKLSLRLRKDFNAMKLLLASSFEIIDLKIMQKQLFHKVNTKNPYFMKFLKIRVSLNDEIKKKNKIKVLLKNL